MKISTFITVLLLFCFIACEKDDFEYSYPETNKLLVSVIHTQNGSEFNTEFKYDSLNRIIEVKNIFPEGQNSTESFSYNGDGKIVSKSSANYLTFYNYNAEGQLIEQIVKYISPRDGWDLKTEFKYKNGKINKGIEYSREGEVQNQISYKYDSRGNTLEKIVRPANNEYDFNLIVNEFKYDTKPNPLAVNGIAMPSGFAFSQYPDIKQINNPVYSSYSNMLMSSIPPEYEISYDYSYDGLPLSARMKNVRFADQEPVIVEYNYRYKD